MNYRRSVLLGLALLFVTSTSSTEAGRRRVCRLWNFGNGYHSCLDNCTGQLCGPVCSQPCNYQEVECTVMVPQTFYETRKITTTQYQRQQRQRTITVYQRVPRKEVRQVNYTVCEPVIRQREIKHWTCRPVWEQREVPYTYFEPVYEQKKGSRVVMRPVWENIEQQCTVMVPRTVWHTGTRTVCRMEKVTQVRRVCVDRGCWEVATVDQPCCQSSLGDCSVDCFTYNDCNPCFLTRRARRRLRRACFTPVCPTVNCGTCLPRTCRVWRPNIVEVEIPHTACRPVYVQEEYRYCTTVWEPQVQTRTVRVCRQVPHQEQFTYTTCRWVRRQGVRKINVCRYVRECSSRVVNYTEWIPRTETREVSCTVYDCVPTEKVITETVCVPVCVEREIQVPVCRLIPQTVVRRIPVPCNSCGATNCQGCPNGL